MFDSGEITLRVNVAVREIAESVTVVRIGSRFCDQVDRGSIGKPELRPKGVPVHLKFLDHIERNRLDPVLPGAVFVFAAVNCGEIVATVAATNRKTRCQEASESEGLGARRV